MRSITVPFEILWADVDPLGYVYYPAIFRFVTQAESTLFRSLGYPDARLLAEGIGKPRIHVDARYHRPLFLHDTGRCTLVVTDVRHSMLRLEFELRRDGETTPAVTGHLVCVFVDVRSRRPVPIPHELRAALAPERAVLATAV
ncbi:MAG: thioesterase family protein [Thermomicrobium sp.]|nr:acyl-CoA thioesterase [Thermomicrobium sp.]MDW8060495.1 thioesterase family protein [Thermomicrobium sp.]